MAEAERVLAGPRLVDDLTDPDTGKVEPTMGGHRQWRTVPGPLGRHVCISVKTPGQNGTRERTFRLPKYERLYREHIDDDVDLAQKAVAFRVESTTVRPHEAFHGTPAEVHSIRAAPAIPTYPESETPPATERGTVCSVRTVPTIRPPSSPTLRGATAFFKELILHL